MVAQTHVSVPAPEARKDSLLRRALVGNVIFSAVSGTLMIAASSWISDFTGLTPGWVPALIGAGVLLWAADVAWIARKEELAAAQAKLVIAGDIAWVVASFAILVAGVLDLTTAGAWTVGVLAEIVGLFAVVQYLGLRRLRS